MGTNTSHSSFLGFSLVLNNHRSGSSKTKNLTHEAEEISERENTDTESRGEREFQ